MLVAAVLVFIEFVEQRVEHVGGGDLTAEWIVGNLIVVVHFKRFIGFLQLYNEVSHNISEVYFIEEH